MMIIGIYALIVFAATSLGSCMGIGGGIIIKPLFDLLHHDNGLAIALYSGHAVMAMTCYSSWRRLRKSRALNIKLLCLISLAAAAGGYAGNYAFKLCLDDLSDFTLHMMQSSFLCLMMLCILIYYIKPWPSLNLKNPLPIFGTGILLGFISAFLNIGGGPANVAAYSWLLGLEIKVSVTYSLATIFCAQIIQLLLLTTQYGYSVCDPTVLLIVMPVAVVGGMVGNYFYRRINSAHLKSLLLICTIAILGLNVYNLIYFISAS